MVQWGGSDKLMKILSKTTEIDSKMITQSKDEKCTLQYV